MNVTTFADRLRDIAPRYRGFIIDQWGVLHDGGEPYPDAIDCLTALRALDVRIVLLSNSGKRAEHNRERLAEMGIGSELFDAVVTSGEACWRALDDRTDAAFADLGNRCFLWSRGGDLAHADGLDLEVVDRAEEAEFLYLAGVPDHAEMSAYLDALEIGARRGLPLICANPDITAIYPNGGRGMAPGAVARRYEELGGKSIYVGKPHRPVYQLCLKELDGLPREALLGIGDSLEHDIAGGNGVGIDTMLLTHGVHREAFARAEDEQAKQAALDELVERYGARPRFALTRFLW
ncbi:MAG: TIGR01459 family HAD-type hydrolase [Alphaproteobacteria bacterium]|nr:TIGR01459 family HAD-type hydrolase [Alphaproteobacteria bacterium]